VVAGAGARLLKIARAPTAACCRCTVAMIIELMNKGLFLALVYYSYKAYETSGGVGDLLGDVPRSLAFAALVFAAAILCLVALLRCVTCDVSDV
jgi:TRAP-type C4-dicarboxylate transport system permease small subunit